MSLCFLLFVQHLTHPVCKGYTRSRCEGNNRGKVHLRFVWNEFFYFQRQSSLLSNVKKFIAMQSFVVSQISQKMSDLLVRPLYNFSIKWFICLLAKLGNGFIRAFLQFYNGNNCRMLFSTLHREWDKSAAALLKGTLGPWVDSCHVLVNIWQHSVYRGVIPLKSTGNSDPLWESLHSAFGKQVGEGFALQRFSWMVINEWRCVQRPPLYRGPIWAQQRWDGRAKEASESS